MAQKTAIRKTSNGTGYNILIGGVSVENVVRLDIKADVVETEINMSFIVNNEDLELGDD